MTEEGGSGQDIFGSALSFPDLDVDSGLVRVPTEHIGKGDSKDEDSTHSTTSSVLTDLSEIPTTQLLSLQQEDASLVPLFAKIGTKRSGGKGVEEFIIHDKLLQRRWLPAGSEEA